MATQNYTVFYEQMIPTYYVSFDLLLQQNRCCFFWTDVVFSKVTDWSLVHSVEMGFNMSVIYLLEVLDEQ